MQSPNNKIFHTMKHFLISLILLLSLQAGAQTRRINFTAAYAYPEGVVYDAANRTFYVSSVKTATIGTVDTAGNYRPVYTNEALKSSYGLYLDTAARKLWICTCNNGYSQYNDPASYRKTGQLISIDLVTHQQKDSIDLAALLEGPHFINDVTGDAQYLYVTDSQAGAVYRVERSTGKAAVFVQHPDFKGQDVGINGIVHHPAGYLLVSNSSTGVLYRIDAAKPGNASPAVSKVAIPQFFPGADGLLWDAQGNLVLIQNKGTDKVYTLQSADGWRSAKVQKATSGEDRFQQPSTGTLYNGRVYVLNSKINELNDPTKPQSKAFSIQEAVMRPVE
jgi:sugar lactone lactonase YvrE